MTSPLKKSKS